MEFKTANEFSMHIEVTALEKEVSAIQLVLDYCEENDIEYSAVKKLINPSLKAKLDKEGQDLGLMKRNNKSLDIL
jgi:hypothetical protein